MIVLAINPGSTSTKMALYENKKEILRRSISHDIKELSNFPSIIDQLDFRNEAVFSALKAQTDLSLGEIDAVVGRGGLLRPLEGGTYRVNEAMKRDLRSARYGSHASNLGALIADQIARTVGAKSFIVDPVVVDELGTLARYSGLPQIQRKSIFHALNQKATAKKAARRLGKSYPECNLIIAHMGGGTTIGIHARGRVVDVNNGLDGDGPFSIERAGSLPAGDWMRYVLEHRDNPVLLQKMLTGDGGIVAYLGTKDGEQIEAAIQAHLQGQENSKGLDGRCCLEVMEALCYQVSKEICALAAVVSGQVDAIILTGGLAFNQRVTGEIEKRVSFLAPVLVYPGENELEALASAAFDALEGREPVKEYSG